eukprot:gene14769-biopygen20129
MGSDRGGRRIRSRRAQNQIAAVHPPRCDLAPPRCDLAPPR